MLVRSYVFFLVYLLTRFIFHTCVVIFLSFPYFAIIVVVVVLLSSVFSIRLSIETLNLLVWCRSMAKKEGGFSVPESRVRLMLEPLSRDAIIELMCKMYV